MRRPRFASISRGFRRHRGLPLLRPGDDSQAVRVMAFLAPAGHRRVWRRDLRRAVASRRAAAAVALGTVLGPSSVMLLGAALLQDAHPHVRATAAETLGLVGGRASARALLRATGDPSSNVRAAVARGLGLAGWDHPEVRGFLKRAVQSRRACVAEAALLALAKFQGGAPVQDVLALVAHPAASVRRAALSILDGLAESSHATISAALQDTDAAVVALASAALASAQ
jgi:HEAT repeat protein